MLKRILFFFYGALIIIGLIILCGFASLPSGKLEVTLLDVGQGDAIFIRTPQNQKILIDAGPAANLLNPLAEEMYFFEKQIDLMVITHPDLDHIAGFTEILRRYEVKNILMTGVQHDTAWYRDILEQITEQEIPVYVAREELDFNFGSILFDVIWPREALAGKKPADANAASIVAKLTYGNTSVLLTGDFEEGGEETLLKTTQNIQADVLKLGHHGSRTSSSEDFLKTVDSKIALISVGQDNKFDHPHAEVLERVRDQEVYSTMERGSVRISSDGEEWNGK